MRYMGGKYRQSKELARVIPGTYSDQKRYVEPFCGAMGAASRLVPVLFDLGVREFWLSDKSAALVTMWQRALYSNWLPPDWVNEEEFNAYKRANKKDPDVTDPMVAWCGHALTFAGGWYNGFAKGGDKGQSSVVMQLNQKRELLRKVRALKKAKPEIVCCDYMGANYGKNSVVYMDPPYDDTVERFKDKTFNHPAFWEYARQLAHDNTVFVTGFDAPDDFKTVYSWGHTSVHHGIKRRDDYVKPTKNERLFVYSGGTSKEMKE